MNLLRGILYGVLRLLEPLVTGLLSTLALLGLLTAGLFHWALPPGALRHTGAILAVSAACAISAALYRGITRLIEPQ
jgi:hypothetical protein